MKGRCRAFFQGGKGWHRLGYGGIEVGRRKAEGGRRKTRNPEPRTQNPEGLPVQVQRIMADSLVRFNPGDTVLRTIDLYGSTLDRPLVKMKAAFGLSTASQITLSTSRRLPFSGISTCEIVVLCRSKLFGDKNPRQLLVYSSGKGMIKTGFLTRRRTLLATLPKKA